MSGTRAKGPQAELVERLRDLLADEPTTREISMFGGRAFLVDERIVVSVWKNGDLLVRVAAERTDELRALPGAAPAEMGSGRRMGAGWITVAAEAIVADGPLSDWLAASLENGHTTR
ncbi:hypothetical protein BH20ACT3_BH20ACT3_03840 [soil metagenome]